MNIQIIKKYMDQWLENKRYEFYDIADKIWANPELGLEEYFAADLLTSVLKKMDLPWKWDKEEWILRLLRLMELLVQLLESIVNMTVYRDCLKEQTAHTQTQFKMEHLDMAVGIICWGQLQYLARWQYLMHCKRSTFLV